MEDSSREFPAPRTRPAPRVLFHRQLATCWTGKRHALRPSLHTHKPFPFRYHALCQASNFSPPGSTSGTFFLSTVARTSLTMPSPMILNYFGLPGRAEATRVALAYAGKVFEDHRMDHAEYGACKWVGKGLPVLEMDGADYTQSTALLRYAGKLGGLYPEDPLAALKVDEIVMIGEDIMGKIFSCMGAKDDTVAKGVLAGKVKTLLDVLTTKIAASPSKFCVGDSLTIADLQVHAVIANVEADFVKGIPPTLIADTAAPLLVVKNAVLEDPKVKAYYASKA